MSKEHEELSSYMKGVCKYAVLSRDEEFELAKKAKSGDASAREKIIVSNLRFVVQVANQFKPYTKSGKITLLDLIQEGNHGLVHAFSKYDPESGYRFTTYAVHWIRAKIMSYIIKTFSIVKIGTTAIERAAFFKSGAIRQILEEKNDKYKGQLRKDLAKQLEVTETTIRKIEERFHWNDVSTEKSMNHDFDDGSPLTIGDLLVAPSVEDEIEQKLFREKIHEALEASMDDLSEREKDIMVQRWLSDDPKTLQELGDEQEISRERVRQIESKVFERIKKYLQSDDLGRDIIRNY
jgi:RNA polymerase sigma-32 factor